MANATKAKSAQDYATRFSLDYLAVIESRLKISWNEKKQPICIPDCIDDLSLGKLKGELADHLDWKSGDGALEATREYGKTHIQTVGFGLASNFDTFVKLGFLYGERVVLWDFMSRRLLSREIFSPSLKSAIAQAACDLMLLRPVIERGGLVILPHPTEWCYRAEKIAADLKQQGNKSAVELGLSVALAAIEDGLQLHPFTLLGKGPMPVAHNLTVACANNFYSQNNYIFQSTAVPFKTLVNIDDVRCPVTGEWEAVEQVPVEGAFSRRV
jgi:hypothetical protein